jgi:hypothetical protein
MAGQILQFCELRDLMRLHALTRATVGWLRSSHRADVQRMWHTHVERYQIPQPDGVEPDVLVRRALVMGQKFYRGEIKSGAAQARGCLVPCGGCTAEFADSPEISYERHQADIFDCW